MAESDLVRYESDRTLMNVSDDKHTDTNLDNVRPGLSELLSSCEQLIETAAHILRPRQIST